MFNVTSVCLFAELAAMLSCWTLDGTEELVCPSESMEEKAAYIHGGQGLLGRDAS